MLGSITFRALGISARRILDRLLYEHMSHGGAENGNLGATYAQIEIWGVTAADVRKGLAELYVTGFVRQTAQGCFTIGGKVLSRYALTWLPTGRGKAAVPPTHDWLTVIEALHDQKIGSIAAARAWLRAEVADHARPTQTLASQVAVLRLVKR